MRPEEEGKQLPEPLGGGLAHVGNGTESTASPVRNSAFVPASNDSPLRSGGPAARALAAAVLLQALLGGYRALLFVAELPRIAPSLLGKAGQPGAFSSLAVLAAVAAVAAAGALGEPTRALVPRLEAAGLWALSTLAAAGVALTAAGVATTRFVPGAGWLAVALVAAAAVLRLARRAGGRAGAVPAAPTGEQAGLSGWDARTALLLLALLVPTVFPFVHSDARAIWGCRALAVAGLGVARRDHRLLSPLLPAALLAPAGVRRSRPRSSPGVSRRRLLLAGHALYLRGAFARLAPGSRPAPRSRSSLPGTSGCRARCTTRTSPLMAFLATAALVTLGVPVRGPGAGALRPGEQAAAALLFAAAVLVRPDGVVYLAVIALRGGRPLRAEARPGRLASRLPPPSSPGCSGCCGPLPCVRPGRSSTSPRRGGRRAARRPGRRSGSSRPTSTGAQGQWFSHYGLGLTIWGLAAIGLALWRRRPPLGLSARRTGW